MSNFSNIKYLTFLKDSGISSFLQNQNKKFYLKKSKQMNLKDINNIEDLIYYINQVKTNLNKNLISKGNISSEIMIIVGNPSQIDVKNNELLSAAEGELMNKMLKAINLNSNKIYICSIIPWLLSENRDPTTDEIMQYLPFIQKHIEIAKPKIMFIMGNTATKAILNTPHSIEKLREKWHNYKTIKLKKSIPTLCTYHPSSLLLYPDYKKQSWKDLKMLQQKILNENL